MRLLVFNPENDLALAADSPYYTPPASALQFARDCCDLPQLWAEPGDYIWHHAATPCDIPVDVLCSIASVQPWGWSKLLVSQLRKAGVPSSLLPTDVQMDVFHAATGRAITERLLQQFHAQHSKNADFIGEAHRCNSLDDVLCFHREHPSMLLKAPWSGSGRGLHAVVAPQLSAGDIAWINRCLQRQGYVMAEPKYRKIMDLALEFQLTDAVAAEYKGLSLFVTSGAGVYAGNLVAGEEAKLSIVGRYIDTQLLTVVRQFYEQQLPLSLDTFYRGPVGIDMMIVDDGRAKLHPCVEVNVRMTMGHVALHLARSQAQSLPALFAITHRDGRYAAELTPCAHQPGMLAAPSANAL